MSDTNITGDVHAANANFGTQTFNGAVYITYVMSAAATPTPTAPPQTRVFLSYVQKDDGTEYDDPAKSLLRRLTNDLSAAKFAVWWDRVSLPSRGVEFSREIEEAIRACDRFVLVVSPGVPASAYVQAELACALRECKPVTPILRDGDFDLLPASIAHLQAPDFRPARAYTAALHDLIARLNEDAPLGAPIGVKKQIPTFYIERHAPFEQARTAVCADSIKPTVISAPPRAVAIFGYGGIGKSTLAAALAHDCTVRRAFRDGVIWLEVGQTPVPSSLQMNVGATVFKDSADNYKDEQNGRLALSMVLRDKAALIVLDDVWDHRIVQHFPIEGTACRLLITTRSGALAREIDGEDIRLGLLTEAEGAQLIAKRAGGSGDDLVYRQIARALGGHTLAITLAAARLYKRGAGYANTILNGLQNEHDPFAQLNVDKEDKDLNLSKSLDQSLGMLDADERRRFRALGVFAVESTFDLAAAAAVWEDTDENAADRALESLCDASLVEAGEDGRYSQHRLLRAYARALLEANGELDSAAERHFAHYAGLHGDAGENNNEDCHPTITRDLENVLIALAWGFIHSPGDAVGFTNALNYYMSLYGSFTQRRELLLRALTAAEQIGARLGLANTLIALGDLSVREADLAAARGYYDRALPVYEQIGARLGLANTLMSVGDMMVGQKQWRDASLYYERALPIARQIRARLSIANILYDYGLGLFEAGEPDKGIEALHECVAIFEAIDPRRWAITSKRRLADLLRRAGRNEEAEKVQISAPAESASDQEP